MHDCAWQGSAGYEEAHSLPVKLLNLLVQHAKAAMHDAIFKFADQAPDAAHAAFGRVADPRTATG